MLRHSLYTFSASIIIILPDFAKPQALTHSTTHSSPLVTDSQNSGKEQNKNASKSLLTFSNIQYLVEGLDTLLVTNLDGDKRSRVIELRNELLNYINSTFDDYS
jgi:hypothetical protein